MENPEGHQSFKVPPTGLRANIVPPESELKEPEKERLPVARSGCGSKGQKIDLLSNHFRVNISNVVDEFYQYSVNVSYEDGHALAGKGAGRKILDQMKQIYDSELGGKVFAYDGEKSLFTVGALPGSTLEFVVLLEDVMSSRNIGGDSQDSPNNAGHKRMRRPNCSKTFKVVLTFASTIPMRAMSDAISGVDNNTAYEALRILDIILRQHAAKQGCLLVRQSFFHDHPGNYKRIGEGVLGCDGFHSSVRAIQAGLSLNLDLSTTMIIQPGPVVDFLKASQNVMHLSSVDWNKAKRMLKNLRIKDSISHREYKITGLSDKACKDQTFTMKQRKNEENGNTEAVEITVYDYFVNVRKIMLRDSANCPCIDVGKPKRPNFLPIELCSLVSLQRYTKALTTKQRATLVETSRQKPNERMAALENGLKFSNYNSDPMFSAGGISIGSNFIPMKGRVLSAPKLRVGKEMDFQPKNGRWNFNDKSPVEPHSIKKWAVVNFSAQCDSRAVVNKLIIVAKAKGVLMEPPKFFQEKQQVRRAPTSFRVDQMFRLLKSEFRSGPGDIELLLCIPPERKNCDIYGPWKKKCLSDYGVVTQCMAPPKDVKDQYLTNLLLKINAKLGGLNSLLSVERSFATLVTMVPTMIVGMDVSHGSPGQPDVPSIAAVVSSRGWPLISRYRACVRTQSPNVEMIENLFKPVSDNTNDEGIMKELLIDFYHSSKGIKPEQIIIFRDGVSESQFKKVLNVEFEAIVESCKFLDAKWYPKFVVIIAQKNHHTRFFQPNDTNNVPPGTVIDSQVCHPRNNDFYLCAHAGMIGTTRPTHYHVLHDDIGFSADDLQELVHSLSFVYQRSTTASSVVAPVCYAHLAAAQMSQFMKFEDGSSSCQAEGDVGVPQLPKLHANVSRSMFFC